MELIDIIEYGIFFLAIYYLYYIYTSHVTLKHSATYYRNNKIAYFLALLGCLLMILSFQVFYFTTFFREHRIFDIVLKIILALFSLANQYLVYDLDEQHYIQRHRKRGALGYFNDGKLMLKVSNRLFLLLILYRFFNRNK